jgi:hypothetical protein
MFNLAIDSKLRGCQPQSPANGSFTIGKAPFTMMNSPGGFASKG